MMHNDHPRKRFSSVSDAQARAKLNQETSSLASIRSLMSQTPTSTTNSYGSLHQILAPSHTSLKLPDVNNTSTQQYRSDLISGNTGLKSPINDYSTTHNLTMSQFHPENPSQAKLRKTTQFKLMIPQSESSEAFPVKLEIPERPLIRPVFRSFDLQTKNEGNIQLKCRTPNHRLLPTRAKLFDWSDSPSEDETHNKKGSEIPQNEKRLHRLRPKPLNRSCDFHLQSASLPTSQLIIEQDLPEKEENQKIDQSNPEAKPLVVEKTSTDPVKQDTSSPPTRSRAFVKQFSRKLTKSFSFSSERESKTELEFYCHMRNAAYEKLGPRGRIGGALVQYKDRIYLFGGEIEGKLCGLAVYNPFKETWKYPNVSGEVNHLERAGHSMNMLKNFLIVFGGEKIIETGKVIHRKCTDEVLVFYPHLKQWNHINTQFFKQETIEPRKYHASCTYNHLLLVYGGINQNEKLLHDFWAFDVDKCKWKRIPIMNSGHDERGIAYHRMCSIFLDTADSNYNYKAKQIPEGFYVFGGRNENGDALSTLKILAYDTSKSGLVWSVPATKGIPPTGRYMHSMSHYRERQMLIVYGGKAGGFRPKGKFDEDRGTFIDDMCVLMLETMNWIKPKILEGHRLRARFGHCACIFTEKIYIFGGSTDDHFTDFYMDKIDLKRSEVEKMKNGIDESIAKVTARVGKALHFLMTMRKMSSNSKKDENTQEQKGHDSLFRRKSKQDAAADRFRSRSFDKQRKGS